MRFLCSLVALVGLVALAKADCGSSYGSSYGARTVIVTSRSSDYCTSSVDLFDGAWHPQAAGWFRGRWFPAGTYRWSGDCWYLRGFDGPFHGFASPLPY